MDPLDTYQSDAVERPLIRRRLFWALVASVIFHIGVVIWFRQTHLARFNVPTDRLVPRVFSVKTITIPDSLLKGDDEPKPEEKKPVAKPLDIPQDTPMVDTEIKMTPVAPPIQEVVKPVASDKPNADSNEVQAITQRVQDNTAMVMEKDLNALKDSLLKDQPANSKNALIKLPNTDGDSARSDAQGMAAASGRLEKLLNSGLHKGDAPVTLPGGALFEFASADLRPASIGQLQKLGMLIKKSPNVTFSIEGYTDSFGDAAYNEELSQARADAVRNWLIQNMDVDPSHIQAKGLGATRFLVPPKAVDMHSQASIDQEKLLEQPNRRVEIRFQFHKPQ